MLPPVSKPRLWIAIIIHLISKCVMMALITVPICSLCLAISQGRALLYWLL